MLALDDIRARLEERVPALAGATGNAAQFAQLVERRMLPAHRVGAFILPGALSGGEVGSFTGLFTQAVDEGASIVLIAQVANDPTGQRALDEITPLIRDTVAAICGWGPADAPSAYVLSRGELVAAQGNALVYQLDFSLTDQLRITP